MSFGIPSECVIVLPDVFGLVVPTDLRISYSNTDYARIELSGVMVESGCVNGNIPQVLASVSTQALMDELHRRIKAKENQQTRKG